MTAIEALRGIVEATGKHFHDVFERSNGNLRDKVVLEAFQRHVDAVKALLPYEAPKVSAVPVHALPKPTEERPQDLDDILDDRAELIALRDSLNEALGETPQLLALASPSPHIENNPPQPEGTPRDASQDHTSSSGGEVSGTDMARDHLYSRDHLTIIIENKLQRAIIEPPGYNNQPVYTVRCAYTKRPLFHSADQALVRMYIDGHYPDHTIQRREIVPQLAPAGQPSTHKVLRKRPRR